MSVTSFDNVALGTAPAAQPLLYRLTKLSYFSAAARARRARYQQALRELNSMTGSELAEFGFTRWDITRVAHEMADRS